MKSINIKYEDHWKYTSKIIKNKAFTLVELIIVITILAILATIAFISFKNYAWNARDGNKLTTLSNIEKWLSLYQIKTGSYPAPDSVYGSGSYSWALLSQVWYVKTNVAQAINMNKVPKDPIVNFEYTYWLSNNKKYYQLGTVLENNETALIQQTYAANYISKVVWNYKWLITFSTWWVKYITNLPSLVFTQTGIQNFEDTWNNPKFVINNGWNLVKPYDTNNTETIETTLEKLTQTGWIQLRAEPMPWNIDEWNSQSGTLKEQLWYSEDEIWGVIYGEKYYTDKQNISWWTSSSSSSSSSSGWPTICTSFTYSAWGPCQVGDTQTRTIETQSPSGCTGWSPETLEQFCTYVAPVVQWRDILWTSCDNDDYVFTQWWVTYRWAWCNSVLWEWFERGKQSNGTDGTISSCYSYDSTNTVWNCPIATSWNAMYSTKTEYDWNTDKGTNNIWWKLYTYAQASAPNENASTTTWWACPSGWRLPTDAEWTALETYLYKGVCRTADWWQCEWLWWKRNSEKNATNNIVEALKIPLAGYRITDGVTFSFRGYLAYLWSSGASTRYFHWNLDTVNRSTHDTSYGFSVRCIKD